MKNELKRFWNKVFGYHIGQKVKLRYRMAVNLKGEHQVGYCLIPVEGTIVGITKDELKLKNAMGVPEGCTLTIQRSQIAER